ncbi:hypothetical protein C8Q75DRAFT_717869 [Abortiporus biennis]|nr:hypothetical protein C8Q75DRAFT_717869 [Abortiporus biennis]
MSPSVSLDRNETHPSISTKLGQLFIPSNETTPDISPIQNLPVELLLDLFVLCSSDPEDDGFASLRLSHVCQAWRDIIVNSPSVWQYITLDDARNLRSSSFQSTLWISRSHNLPLYLRLHISDLDEVLRLMSPLLPHMHRWRRCSLIGKLDEEQDFTHFKDGSLPRLVDFHITIRGSAELQDANDASSTPIFSSPYSKAHEDFSIQLSVLSLPSLISVPFNIHTLHIFETIEVTPDPVRLLRFLSFCPLLQYLHYVGYPQEPSYPERGIRPPIVALPRLKILVIRSICSVRLMLSHLHLPSLNELYLEHTNMEFEPMSVPLYPYADMDGEAEDGDSDDENQDFSQSPWSDQATGMGLRSLIKRSNPPLEVLAMDYADMRTKDFEWCFDRLEWLQDFRIVASDMSDKVIGMLAPFKEGVVEFHISNLGSTTPPSGSLQVRLPKLNKLELWNCQRLSGDAVVHALGSRARYTDRASDVDPQRFVKMSHVGVIQCTDFGPRHAVNLLPVLGSRLRVS